MPGNGAGNAANGAVAPRHLAARAKTWTGMEQRWSFDEGAIPRRDPKKRKVKRRCQKVRVKAPSQGQSPRRATRQTPRLPPSTGLFKAGRTGMYTYIDTY